MANNPYNNKVQLNDGTVLMDLTGDTVTPVDLALGVTAHDRSGAAITGTQKGFIYYGTCSTAADTQAKTVSIDGITEYYAGLNVRILFSNVQSYAGVPTLNINNLGAKNICRAVGTLASSGEWFAGEVLDLVYDGTRFVIIADGFDYRGYGRCETASNVAAKEVYVEGFRLVNGISVFILFVNNNTASNPTLNVNGTGAFPMYNYSDVPVAASSNIEGIGRSAYYHFVYRNQAWSKVGYEPVLAMSQNDADAGTSTANYLISPALLKREIGLHETTYDTITQAEVTAGTGTDPRVITPALLKSAVQTHETTYNTITQAEVTAGTGTDPRVITPALLKTAVETHMGTGATGYAKFADGTMIQWGKKTSLSVNLVAAGALYTQSYSLDFPLDFKDADISVTASFGYHTGNAYACGVTYGGLTKSGATIVLMDVIARSGSQGRLVWQAVGRWK